MGDKELTRKIAKAVVVVTTPDVCKAPTVPTPFVSYSKFDLSIETADTVKMTSEVSFTRVSRLSQTLADEGGVGGGVKSQVFGGMCRPFSGWSSTVFVEGNEICRHDVVMEVNCAGPEGPGNTYGKVYYYEALTCSSVTSDGEIVVDETPSEESTGSDADSDATPDATSETTESAPADEDQTGFTGEVEKRIDDEISEAKQSAQDVYDIATSPEARQEALDTVGETVDAAKEDPVGFAKEAGGAIIEDVTEPFGTAAEHASKGDFGGAAASAGYGILNIFNPFKKLKILQKIGKLGKGKKGKAKSHDSKSDSKDAKSDQQVSNEPPEQEKDGGTVRKADYSNVSDKKLAKLAAKGDKDAAYEQNKRKIAKAEQDGNLKAAEGPMAENKVADLQGDQLDKAGHQVKTSLTNTEIDGETGSLVYEVKSGKDPFGNSEQIAKQTEYASSKGKDYAIYYKPENLSNPASLDKFLADNPGASAIPIP